MSERLIGFTFSDEDIKKMHLPLTDRPADGLNAPCYCPVCQPTSEEPGRAP